MAKNKRFVIRRPPIIGVVGKTSGERQDNYLAALNAIGLRGIACKGRGDFRLCNGFVLTGSSADVSPYSYGKPELITDSYWQDWESQNLVFSAIEQAARSGMPLLGVCYGLQAIAVYFGGTLKNIEGHTNYERPWFREVEPKIHKVYDQTGELEVECSHHQAVDALPPDWEGIATHEDGTIEAIRHPQLPNILAVQWHPERYEKPARTFLQFGEMFR